MFCSWLATSFAIEEAEKKPSRSRRSPILMKYWGYLLAKLVAAAALVWSAGVGLSRLLPRQAKIWNTDQEPFGHDLAYTAAMMVYFLFCIGILYLAVWDQRYRCRACVRKLRM